MNFYKFPTLPNVLARNMAHPFGSNKRTVDTFFPIDNKEA